MRAGRWGLLMGALAAVLFFVLLVSGASAAVLHVTESFGSPSVTLGGTTSMTIAISESGGQANTTFTDTLPAGLIVANVPNERNSCGGTLRAFAGSSSVTLTGGSVSNASLCDVTVEVTGTSAGTKDNPVTVTDGAFSGSGTASVLVLGAPAADAKLALRGSCQALRRP